MQGRYQPTQHLIDFVGLFEENATPFSREVAPTHRDNQLRLHFSEGVAIKNRMKSR